MTTQLVSPREHAPHVTDGLIGDEADATRAIHLACIWAAVPFVVMLAVGLIAAGFIPPMKPSSSPAEIAATYRTNTDQIRIGLAFSFLGIILLFPFGMAIAGQTRRLEGGSPVLTYIQIACLGSGSLTFVISWIFWFAAAFRPERTDAAILLINDIGWITFVIGFVAFFAWLCAIGVAILSDTRAEPIFPRWLGYLNLFVAMSFLPDICIPFFKTGAFSWAGIFPFWLPFGTFFLWIILMTIHTAKAIKHDPGLTAAPAH